jgi:RNA polymerase sigma factor (sigma-70 family)
MRGTDAEPTVYVVEDDSDMRRSLEWALKSEGLRVAAFGSPQEFLDTFDARCMSGCLVLDLRLPGMTGLDVHRQVRARGGTMPFVVITAHGDVPHAVAAMRQGALDFIEKPFSRQQLLDRIREALSADAEARRRAHGEEAVRQRLAKLTPRERGVLDLVVEGKLTKEIARRLGISPKTVEVHRSNLVRKMDVECVAQLVRQVVTLRLEAEV